MATTDGKMYTCDRDETAQFVANNDAREREKWHVINRTTKDGASIERLLCQNCFNAYVALATAQDNAFYAFMDGGDE